MSNHSDTAANPSNSASGAHETNDSRERTGRERDDGNGFDAEDKETDTTTLTKAKDE